MYKKTAQSKKRADGITTSRSVSNYEDTKKRINDFKKINTVPMPKDFWDKLKKQIEKLRKTKTETENNL